MLSAGDSMYLGRRSWCYALETSCILEDVLDATHLRLHVSWKTFLMLRAGDFMYLGRRSWCYAPETSCILEGVLDATRWRLHVSWKTFLMLRTWDFMYLERRSWCYALETSCILEDVLDATRLRLHVSWKTFLMLRAWDFMYFGDEGPKEPLWKSLGALCSKFKRWKTHAQPWLQKRHQMLRGLNPYGPNVHCLVNLHNPNLCCEGHDPYMLNVWKQLEYFPKSPHWRWHIRVSKPACLNMFIGVHPSWNIVEILLSLLR